MGFGFVAVLVFGIWDTLRPGERAIASLLGVGKFVPHPRRQLSGNANPPTPSNRGQPESTTTSHRHTRSIVCFLLLFAWPNITPDFSTFSGLALAYRDESCTHYSALMMPLHPMPRFQLSPTHRHSIFIWADILNIPKQEYLVSDHRATCIKNKTDQSTSAICFFVRSQTLPISQSSSAIISHRHAVPWGSQSDTHLPTCHKRSRSGG